MKPRVLFLSNYPPGHVISDRARFFASSLEAHIDAKIEYRFGNRRQAFRSFLRTALTFRPSLIYTLDGLAAELTAFIVHLLRGTPYIIDCASTLMDGFRISGRSFFYWKAADAIDRIIMGNASAVVTRGLIQKIVFESRYYNPRIEHLSEGVDIERWIPKDGHALRQHYGLEDCLVIGVIGSIAWSEQFQWAYGREVIEVLRILRDHSICGVILPSITSDDRTLNRLENMAKEYGVDNKLRIIRNVPREKVPDYLAMMDVCISTQLPNIIGEMRTTAKLPEYLACGKFILATRVGDARFYLPEEMLIDYDGDYYYRLAHRILKICTDRSLLMMGSKGVEIARKYFNYREIAAKAANLIQQILQQ
jgi:glycosyltransferase involved in cell wall biosynthesis